MAGPGGLPPILPTTIPLATAAPALQVGDVLQGTVRGTTDQLFLHIAGRRIPVDSTPALQPGQAVRVAVVQSEMGPQLRLLPPVTAQPPATTAADTAGLLRGVLQTLNALHAQETMAGIIPSFLRQSEPAMRMLVRLLLRSPETLRDTQLVNTILRQAVQTGVLPEQMAAQLTALLSDELPTMQQLQRALTRARTSAEARLAGAGATSGQGALEGLADDALVALRTLRGHEGLIRHLTARGQLQDFQQAVDRIIERLTGSQLQNLRGVDMPYLFLEVPAPGDFQHLHIHLFGDGREGRNGFSKEHATVALDLSLSRLGDLWVALTIVEGRCSCTFRATEQPVVDAINDEAEALRDGLAEAGYPQARVQATLWQGDRLAEVATLMRRFSGLNVRA